VAIVNYFPYLGPNRRSDQPVVEIILHHHPDDEPCSQQRIDQIRQLLCDSGIISEREPYPQQPLPDDPVAWYASWLVQTALLFQRKAGHRVELFSVSFDVDRNYCTAWLEHEHCDVGMNAVKLAVELLSGKCYLLTEAFAGFCEFARARLLPRETEAIIKAARQRDIPCTQLDRFPHTRNRYKFCVRENGLLMLGHGAFHHVLDGTFCLDKAGDRLSALLRNQSQRKAILHKLGVATSDCCVQSKAGEHTYHLLAIGGNVIAVTEQSGKQAREVGSVHPSLLDIGVAVCNEVEGFPVVLSLVTTDISKTLAETGGRVVDFELGPEFERLLPSGQSSELFNTAISALLDWLFKDSLSIRIPILSITGTNGKTTTSRMISQTMKIAGRKPGLVTTDGIYINGKQTAAGDSSSLLGHSTVVSSRDIDVAILESHHRGLFLRGFVFLWCDVAVCLNVTNDHLDEMHIRSVEEMAVIKRSLLERARYVAVLNADDQHCLAMIKYVVAEKLCLVSMQFTIDELRTRSDGFNTVYCVLERIDSHDWVVLYDSTRLAVMPVASMPSTFGGLARFNVSNAMHAIAVSYVTGIDLGTIRTSMQHFEMSFENTPGRLNFYTGHSFKVLLDFAHNPDGLSKLCDFVDSLSGPGYNV